VDTSKEYIKMCEKAEKIQKFWRDKKSHIEDIMYINEDNERLLVLKEPIFHLSEYADKKREHICFEQYGLFPIPLTKFDKDPFYRYDDENLNIIWLPRQDQLQEMVGLTALEPNIFVLMNFSRELYNVKEKFSWEQLWLAFVMKEKYNKIWNGKEWEVNNGKSN